MPASVRPTPPIAPALLGPLGTAALLAAISLALAYGGAAGPDERGAPAATGRAVVRDDGLKVHVTPVVPAGEGSTGLVVHGPDGEDLVSVVVRRDGDFSLEASRLGPVRFVVHGDPARHIHLGASNGRASIAYTAKADGAFDLDVACNGPADGRAYGLRVDAAGNAFPPSRGHPLPAADRPPR